MDDTNKRILRRIGCDILIVILFGLPLLYYNFWVEPYKRGFYCDDKSLHYPYKDSTVRSWMLYFIGIIIPVTIISIIEFSITRTNTTKTSTNQLIIIGIKIPDWILMCYQNLGQFAFGLIICQLTVDITKYSIGRLRPHFQAVCQPVFHDGTTCKDTENFGKYIEEYTCQGGGNFSKRLLKEINLSFPSGHSSFTFFVMIYLILYLQKRMNICTNSRFLCLFIQFIFITIAWFTAFSRVYDYKHHLGDILVGASIGTIFAFIASYKLPKNLFNWKTVTQQSYEKLN